MKRLSLCLVGAILCIPAAHATQPLTGRIVNSAGDGMAYATVVLLRDGVQAAGTAADSLGIFRLSADPGRYTLRARSLACQPFEQAVNVEAGRSELGTFYIEVSQIAMREVVVSASAVTREADRFILTVGDTPALAGKDGTELLAEAPGVWIDDKSVAINGMKGVKVYIDERELRLDGEKTIDYLRSLTAADIARIEVIPQAGSEYAADARGGVLRITLRRRAQNGMNGSFSATTLQGTRLSAYAPSVNASLRAGKWTVNAAGSGRFTTRSEHHLDELRTYPTDATTFSGTSDIDGGSNFGSGRLGVFWDPTPHHSFGAEAEYTSEHGDMPSLARTDIAQSGIETSAASRYARHIDERTLAAAFNYVWKIDTVGSALKLLLDYTRRRNTGNNEYRTTFTSGALSRDTLYRSATAAKYDIFSAGAGLVKRFAHELKLQAGVKYTRNRLANDALYEGHTANGWEAKQAYNYSLGYTEQIAAGYASLSAGIGRWKFSAGLRGEYTATDGHGDRIHASYFGLSPNASANVALNRMQTWMLSAQYSRNIERPGFLHLNPTRIQFSDYGYQVGNPALRPTYIHRLSLTAIWKYRYTLTVGGNLHRDLIREVIKTDPANPDITFVTPENHYLENHWFAALSAPVQLMRNWTLTVNLVGVRQDIRLRRETPLSGHWLLFTNVTSGVTLPAKFYLELTYSGQSRLYSGTSEVVPRHMLHAALKKRLCRDRLTISVAVRNLNGARESYLSQAEGLLQSVDSYSAWGSRHVKIGLTWNFRSGHDFKSRQIEGAADAERQRLKKSERQ